MRYLFFQMIYTTRPVSIVLRARFSNLDNMIAAFSSKITDLGVGNINPMKKTIFSTLFSGVFFIVIAIFIWTTIEHIAQIYQRVIYLKPS